MSLAVTELWGKVDATKSRLNIGSTKLELIMKKKTSGSWKKLHAEEIGATVFFGMRDKKPHIWVCFYFLSVLTHSFAARKRCF